MRQLFLSSIPLGELGNISPNWLERKKKMIGKGGEGYRNKVRRKETIKKEIKKGNEDYKERGKEHHSSQVPLKGSCKTILHYGKGNEVVI